MNVTVKEHAAYLTKLSKASEDVGTWAKMKLTEWLVHRGARRLPT